MLELYIGLGEECEASLGSKAIRMYERGERRKEY